jgi:hypothetical protein
MIKPIKNGFSLFSAIIEQESFKSTERLMTVAGDLLSKTSVRNEDRPGKNDLVQALRLGIDSDDLNGRTRDEVYELISKKKIDNNYAKNKFEKAREQAKQLSTARKESRLKRANEDHIKNLEEQLPIIIQGVGLLGVSLDTERLKNYYNHFPNDLIKDFSQLEIFSQTMGENGNELSKLNVKDLNCLSKLSLHLQGLIVGKTLRDEVNPKYVVQRGVDHKGSQELTLFSPGNILEITRLSLTGRTDPTLSAQIIVPPGNQGLLKAKDFLYTPSQTAKPGFTYAPSEEAKYVINQNGSNKRHVLTLGDLVFFTQLKKEGS